MKKAAIGALVFVLLAAVAFGLGFYTGRSTSSQPITVSALAEPTDITAAATTEAATGMAVRETAASTVAAETAGASEDGKININTATVAELTTISGIGEVLAQRIVDYREEHGDFTSLEELTNVTGIGEKRLEAIMDAATVGG